MLGPTLTYLSAIAPQNALGLGVSAMQVAIAAMNTQSPTEAPYSKFSDSMEVNGAKVSGRNGMLLIYVPSFAYSSLAALPQALNMMQMGLGNGREAIVAAMLVFHFGKRILEVLFLHKYSGDMSAAIGGSIGVYYAILSAIIFSFSLEVPELALNKDLLPVGLALFAIGQLGNFFHHWLLASLRSQPSISAEKSKGSDVGSVESDKIKKRQYKVPTGGLFPLVATPHYFFELVAWLGLAVVASQLNAYLGVLGMATYLGARAQHTSEWYRENVPGYPKERKNMIPFLF
jgi:hypothetical protein